MREQLNKANAVVDGSVVLPVRKNRNSVWGRSGLCLPSVLVIPWLRLRDISQRNAGYIPGESTTEGDRATRCCGTPPSARDYLRKHTFPMCVPRRHRHPLGGWHGNCSSDPLTSLSNDDRPSVQLAVAANPISPRRPIRSVL